MKQLVLVLAAILSFHSTQAQLLNKLKEKAGAAVKSASGGLTGGSSGGSTGGSMMDNAVDKAEKKVAKQSIIFSKTPFKDGETKSTATDFLPTDNIYARVLLPTTIQAMLEKEAEEDKPETTMQVGLTTPTSQSLKYNYVYITIPKSQYNKPYFDLDILPAPGKVNTKYEGIAGTTDHISTLFRQYGDLMTDIPFGKQTYTLEFGDKSGIVGSFDFTVPDKRAEKTLNTRLDALVTGLGNAIAKDTKLPDVFKTAGGKFTDPQLSAANLKRLLGPSTIKFVVGPGAVDYNVSKNELGVPQYKITAKPIWAVYKGDDGNCYYTKYFLMRQYEGGGKYGPLDFAATTADVVQIACENVK